MTQPPLDDRGLPKGYDFHEDLEITPRQVNSMLEAGEDFLLIDCRLKEEWNITHIDQAKLIPLQEIPQHLEEIAPFEQKPIIVHCRSGARSLKATHYLKSQGFENVRSMAGGILLYNRDLRPDAAQY